MKAHVFKPRTSRAKWFIVVAYNDTAAWQKLTPHVEREVTESYDNYDREARRFIPTVKILTMEEIKQRYKLHATVPVCKSFTFSTKGKIKIIN